MTLGEEGIRFFFYGTLMDVDVLNAVADNPFGPEDLLPARLDGWRRVAVREARYPALVPAEGRSCDGVVVENIDGRMERRLVHYEGPQYRQAAIEVTVHGKIKPARVFVPKAGMAFDTREWSFEAWQAEHKPDYLRRLAGPGWQAT